MDYTGLSLSKLFRRKLTLGRRRKILNEVENELDLFSFWLGLMPLLLFLGSIFSATMQDVSLPHRKNTKLMLEVTPVGPGKPKNQDDEWVRVLFLTADLRVVLIFDPFCFRWRLDMVGDLERR